MALDGQVLVRSFLLIAAGVAIIAIVFYYNGQVSREGFTAGSLPPAAVPEGPPTREFGPEVAAGTPARPLPQADGKPRGAAEEDRRTEAAPVVAPAKTEARKGEFGNLKPEDLLPRLGNTPEEQRFAQLNPAGQGDVAGVNFLDAGALIGQSTPPLRNSNLQLRSDPPIEKKNVSPWLMSTINPVQSYRTLEIH